MGAFKINSLVIIVSFPPSPVFVIVPWIKTRGINNESRGRSEPSEVLILKLLWVVVKIETGTFKVTVVINAAVLVTICTGSIVPSFFGVVDQVNCSKPKRLVLMAVTG